MKRENKKIVVLSPPFYSHFQPLKTLAKALKTLGAQVTIACSGDFQEEIEDAGLDFHLLNINKNQNTGIAKNTQQDREEKKRLEEFFQATYEGPVKTLITQGDHRIRDMFSNPGELIDGIRQLNQKHLPDLMIVDQLSYGATLALIGLEIPFVTFCPPHPETIESKEESGGLTEFWPRALEPSKREKHLLGQKQKEVNNKFAEAFKEVFTTHFPNSPVDKYSLNNPFSLTSSLGVFFNYPKFSNRSSKSLSNGTATYYSHYCFEPEKLEGVLKSQVLKEKRRKVLISFGTFLSERRDVIEALIQGFITHKDSWHIYVATGGNEEFFIQLSADQVTRAAFLPQKALLPYMDLVVHHGGANSFTETLYYGKPMIILPFSSDQFAIAYDVERNQIGEVLDPNQLTKEDLHRAIEKTGSEDLRKSLRYWKDKSQEKGPLKGARWIMDLE